MILNIRFKILICVYIYLNIDRRYRDGEVSAVRIPMVRIGFVRCGEGRKRDEDGDEDEERKGERKKDDERIIVNEISTRFAACVERRGLDLGSGGVLECEVRELVNSAAAAAVQEMEVGPNTLEEQSR